MDNQTNYKKQNIYMPGSEFNKGPMYLELTILIKTGISMQLT